LDFVLRSSIFGCVKGVFVVLFWGRWARVVFVSFYLFLST